MEPKYQKGTYVEFAKDSGKGAVKPAVFPYPLKVVNIKPSKPSGYMYRLENNRDYYEEELQPVRPIIVHTTVVDNEIQNNLIKDTKAVWKTEIDGVKERILEFNNQQATTNLLDDVLTFLDRSVPGDVFDDVAPNGRIGFELVNKDGHLYGELWEEIEKPYNCVIEELVQPN